MSARDKFNKGDKATLEVTIDYPFDHEDVCTVSIEADDGERVYVIVKTSELTLTKRATPPRPKAGTLIDYNGVGRYIIHDDGTTTWIEPLRWARAGEPIEGDWSWDDNAPLSRSGVFDHLRVKVIG